MSWNEFVGCGRPYQLEWEALLARMAEDWRMLAAVTDAIREHVGPDAQARAAIAAVIKELDKVKLGSS